MIDMYGQSGASIITEGIQEKLQNLSKLNITQKQNVVKENEENIETPDNSVKKESMVIEKQGNIEKSDNSGKKESMVIKRTLKIEHFIHDCIQRALAALKDPEDDTSRTTERLKNTLRLLDNSEGNTYICFFCVLLNRTLHLASSLPVMSCNVLTDFNHTYVYLFFEVLTY